MDERALRLEQIRIDFQASQQVVELQSRRHMAVFAVAATTTATALATAAFGHAAPAPAFIIAATGTVVMGGQLRELGRLAIRIDEGRRKARIAIERLMDQEEEP